MVTFGFLRKVKDGIVTVRKKIGSAVKTVAAPIVKAGLHFAPAIGTVVGAMYGESRNWWFDWISCKQSGSENRSNIIIFYFYKNE